MDKNLSNKPSIKDASLLAWRVGNAQNHARKLQTNHLFSERPRLREGTPTIN
jgi:hypothetical protein